MEPRRTTKTVSFKHAFTLSGVGRTLQPGDYEVITEEELIEGLSFAAFRRLSTVMFVRQGSCLEMIAIDPAELLLAQERDAAI